MEIKNNNDIIEISAESKSKIYFDTKSLDVSIENLNISYPGEYEKNGILAEVKEYKDLLFYSFSVDGKHVLIISNDNFEYKEEIYSFFGDVDVLVIVGSKSSVEIFENIEARIVIPYGESKDLFLQSLGQNIEEQEIYKIKSELPSENTEFVNLI